MMQRRWKLSSAQRADMWSRWKAGQSLNAIGRALGKDKQVIHFLLARHGGIAPPVRRRSGRALTINGHERRWDFKLRRINCKPVLRRPLETTPFIRRSPRPACLIGVKP